MAGGSDHYRHTSEAGHIVADGTIYYKVANPTKGVDKCEPDALRTDMPTYVGIVTALVRILLRIALAIGRGEEVMVPQRVPPHILPPRRV